jgi:hypothetical protein
MAAGLLSGTPASAEAIFGGWLMRRGTASAESFVALVQAHPEQGDSLRALYERWIELEPVLRMALGPKGRVQRIADRLAAARSIAISVLALLLAGILLLQLWSDMGGARIAILPIRVPNELEDAGFGSGFLTSGIYERIRVASDDYAAPAARGSGAAPPGRFSSMFVLPGSELDVVIPETGMTLHSIGNLVRRSLGHSYWKVEGFVTKRDTVLTLTFRIQEAGSTPFSASVEGSAVTPEMLIELGARKILESLQWQVLLFYLASEDPAAALLLADDMLRRGIGDDEAFTRGLKGYAFIRMGRPTEAATEIRRAIGLGQVDVRTYSALGDALRGSKDFEGAADAYEKAIMARPADAYALEGLRRAKAADASP